MFPGLVVGRKGAGVGEGKEEKGIEVKKSMIAWVVFLAPPSSGQNLRRQLRGWMRFHNASCKQISPFGSTCKLPGGHIEIQILIQQVWGWV